MTMSRRQNIVSEISSDFLTCHICLDTYERPKTLNCGHFFCRDCLFNYFKQNQQTTPHTGGRLTTQNKCRLYCPTCRVEVGIIQPGWDAALKYVENLSDNFYVNSLKDLVADHSTRRSTRSQSDRGEGLNAKNVTSKNVARSKSMSETCPVESLSGQASVPCATHPDRMIYFYCLDHLEVLCERCRESDHKGCTGCVSIEEAEHLSIRPRVRQMIESLNARHSSLLQSMEIFTLERHFLQMESFSIEKQVDDMKLNLEAKLSENALEIKENLKKLTSEIERKAVEKLESVKSKESIITELAEHFQILLKNDNVFELAAALCKVDIPVVEDNTHQPCSTAIHYSSNELLNNLLKNSENIFGEITASSSSTTGENHELETQGASAAMPVVGQTITRTALEACGISTDASSKVPTMSSKCSTDEMGLNLEGLLILSSVKETLRFPTIMDSSSRCCILKNGNIAVLDGLKNSISLYDNTGVFLASLVLPSIPVGLASCKDNRRNTSMAVTGQNSTIYFLSTTSQIQLAYTQPTRVQYSDIACIPKRLSLVALAEFENPPLLDLISLQGQVLRTFQTTDDGMQLFLAPKRIATSTEYIFVLDNNCLRLISWESDLVKTISTFRESEFQNLSAISGSKCNNGCIFVDSKKGRVFSLLLDNNKWKLEKMIDDKTSVIEPCDLSSRGMNFALLVGGCQVRMFSIPRFCKGQATSVLDMDDKYQTR